MENFTCMYLGFMKEYPKYHLKFAKPHRKYVKEVVLVEQSQF